MKKIILIMSFLLGMTGLSYGFDPIQTGFFSDVTVDGYDSTAYFSQNKAVSGKKKFTHEWQGVKWRFATEADMQKFAANPTAYAPQFGGYCANQMSLGNLSSVDGEVWLIHEDKLYLFGHDAGRARWKAQGVDQMIKDATEHYANYLAGNGS